jgi:hypothetical protein
MEEFFKYLPEWLTPSRASYGNPNNTYSNTYRHEGAAQVVYLD